jgi:sigma-54 dependent transcriptional regulator, acetoin dehydrogenase operon transcriptional activator AcoR
MSLQHRAPAGAAVPTDPTRAFREIGRAWERFVSSGELASGAIRPLIVQRWQRCRELAIDPTMARAPIALTPEEVDGILARQDLGRAGRQVLDDFAQAVDGTRHVIVLADAEGRIIYSAGHARLQRTLDRLNLAPGGAWSEAAVGPNGIGTPIATGQPETVFGPEHYCQGWQPWVCYGCPVREPETGRILGGVDITGPARKAHVLTFALTVSIARSIEQVLLVYALRRRDVLLSRFRHLERRWPSNGLVAVNERGKIVDLNPAAERALGLQSSAGPDARLLDLVPELWAPVRQAIASGRPAEERLAVRSRTGEDRLVLCRAEPIVRQGDALGSVLVLSDPAESSRGDGRRSGGRASTGGVSRYAFADLLGDAPPFQAALELARAAAHGPHTKPVLLIGESGTGKELVAHAIHRESPRAGGPFVAVNCGAVPRELAESELFGYAAGAFTGARREGAAGKFEAAHGGTLFLDEVDSISLELQGKFLRILEGGEVVRLGSAAPVVVDVRLIAAASADLRRQVEAGSFRLDLFHRLSVVEIVLPPLRDRGDDILTLARVFLDQECTEAGRASLALPPEVGAWLCRYHWPGNARELRNLCARWALTVAGPTVLASDVPAHMRGTGPALMAPVTAELAGSLRGVEDAIIRRTLTETGGQVAEAARRLRVAKTTIYRRLKRWGADG